MISRLLKSIARGTGNLVSIYKSASVGADEFWDDVGGGGASGKFVELKDDANGHYQAYKQIVWVRRCIDLRAASIAAIPLKLYRVRSDKKNGGVMKRRRILKRLLEVSQTDGLEARRIEKSIMERLEVVEDHSVVSLLSDVNPFSMNRSDLWRNTEQNVQIYGQAFWLMEGLGSKTPREIYLLPNKKVTVKAGKAVGEYISGYEYKANENSNPIIYPPGNIIHFRQNDPDNPIEGLSPQSGTMSNVNSYLAAARWNYIYFKNAIRPSGFVELPINEEVDIETEKMIAQAVNAVHQGVENSSQVGILSNGAHWEPYMDSGRDSDWHVLQADNRDAFCASQGTPLFLVSHDAAHLATAKQADESFYTSTVIPRARWYEEVLFWDFLPLFPDTKDMVLRFDLSEVPALEQINASKMERHQKAAGVPILKVNEARKAVGESDLGPAGDVLYIPANMIPITDTGIEENVPEPEDEESEEEPRGAAVIPIAEGDTDIVDGNLGIDDDAGA